VISGLEEMFGQAIESAVETVVNNKVTLRKACYINAIKNLHHNYEDVGICFSKA
jgi:hypothetical protein